MTALGYRRRLQELADYLVPCLPPAWSVAVMDASFPDRDRTRISVSYRVSADSVLIPVEIPTPQLRSLIAAARAVRHELLLAANPDCKSFIFSLTESGKSALDVQY